MGMPLSAPPRPKLSLEDKLRAILQAFKTRQKGMNEDDAVKEILALIKP